MTVVTGASGWLGSALMRALTADEGIGSGRRRVRALVCHPHEAESLAKLGRNVEVHVGDVADRKAVEALLGDAEGTDVFHCAGVVHPPSTDEFERVNVAGTQTVVDVAHSRPIRRLVHVSSSSPFGVNPSPDDVFRAEEPFNPYMEYGRSRMRAEEIVSRLHGPEWTIVRPPWLYGPFQPRRQTRFLSAVRRGRFPLVGDGSNRRSMVYVPALVEGLVRAELAEAAAGRAYWVADRRPYEMKEVIEAVREALRTEGYSVSERQPRLPAVVSSVAERVDRALQARGRYLPEVHVLSEMNKTIACDVSRAVRELGYRPPDDLLPGIRASVRWCRERRISL